MRDETGPRPLGGSFWRLFSSSTGSNLSDGILQAALPLVAASLTRDPLLVSLVASLAFLPWLLFAIPAGALVDRVDRRRAMQAANLFRAATLFGLAAAIATGAASIGVLYVAAFLLGVAETVYDNAARAMLPRVVRRDQLERGNSLLSTAESVTNLFLGAPLGALLFALAAVLPLGASVALYVVAAVLVGTVRGSFVAERAARTTLAGDIREGLGWLVRHPILRQLVWVTGLGAFGNSVANGIAVLFALDVLGIGEAAFGLVLAAVGVGAVLGALASPALTRALGRTGAMGASGTVLGLALVGIGLWPSLWVTLTLWPLGSFAVSAFNVQVMSVRQVLIPDALFGRVQGAYRTVLWGSIPLGAVTGGAIAAATDLPTAIVVGGVLATVAGLATWWVLAVHRRAIATAFLQEDDPVTG
ncbi:MFS transporter [Agrococcus sp. HG114]|uniref:MFS transporter n=1 Tax=Agrococcus sp. HG114 TaxID=2969757 RepID=UPI00215AB6BB|nr:MFS transporter [Agrococcus sp. HG114]MCR8669756.1 MFS transporter [Agrococcus sp. HG114]